MKTDKELLILSAKSAGITGEYTDHYCGDYYDYRNGSCGIETEQGELWNALDYDGDALRLAVDLDIGTFFHDDGVKAFFQLNGVTDFIAEPYGNDKHAATRRAIVRAAAAIGEAME